MKVIDKVAWILIDGQKVLTAKSNNKSKYYIPGGKREDGESDEETLVREVREELSVEISASDIQYFGTFSAQADGHDPGVVVQMTCYFAVYTGKLKPSSEIESIAWLDCNDFDKVAPVDVVIFSELRSLGLIN